MFHTMSLIRETEGVVVHMAGGLPIMREVRKSMAVPYWQVRMVLRDFGNDHGEGICLST